MFRLLAPVIVGALAALVLLLTLPEGRERPYDAAACWGPPLGTLEAREEARTKGYEILREYDCIDRASVEGEEARQRAKAEKPAAPVQPEPARSLAEARRGFQTRISSTSGEELPLPEPPAHLFVRSDYVGAQGRTLPAFVTPDPGDGKKHPAIVWLTGGDTSSLGDFWTPGPDANDQSARAFREAGVVTMFPTLRGGNQDAGGKEYFFGEVDDVLAAAEHLARLPYVDARHLYLGGHSTGGTLALLTAESSGRFEAVFAFGPVSEIDRYPPSLVPVRFAEHDALERKLRSPIHWLHGIASPTYAIEGEESPGNVDELEKLCRKGDNPLLHCIPVPGVDHFGVLSRVTRTVAARVAVSGDGIAFGLRPEDFR